MFVAHLIFGVFSSQSSAFEMISYMNGSRNVLCQIDLCCWLYTADVLKTCLSQGPRTTHANSPRDVRQRRVLKQSLVDRPPGAQGFVETFRSRT